MAADDARRRNARAERVHSFAAQLRAERDRVAVELEQWQALERSLSAQLSEPVDAGDRGLVQQEVDRLQPLVERAAERIDEIQRLLDRAAQGRLAVCDRCDGQIPLERLLALPGSTLCTECTEDAEREDRRQQAAEE